MTDAPLVLVKLARLREWAATARQRRGATPEALAVDTERRDALALALLVAVQEAVDLAYHIATDEGWGIPDSHAAAFALLAREAVLTTEQASALARVAKVRNRIAHGYGAIDHERLWRELPEGLDALESFARSVAAWLPAG